MSFVVLTALTLVSVTPSTLASALVAAKQGDTLKLHGAFDRLVVRGKQGLRIDARGATLTGVEVLSSADIIVRGGVADAGSLQAWRSVFVRDSSGIRIEGMTITNAMTGVAVLNSRGTHLIGNVIHRVRSDCMQLAGAPGSVVDGNVCRDTVPNMAVYDAAGKLVQDGDHPDCVQIWPLPGFPSQDIRITRNFCVGMMQGIFGSSRDGDRSGANRMIITDNQMRIGFWHGITVSGMRNSVVTGNRVEGDGTVHLKGGRVRPWVRIEGEGNRVCGNSTSDWPPGPAC